MVRARGPVAARRDFLPGVPDPSNGRPVRRQGAKVSIMRRIVVAALGAAAFLPVGADAAGTGFDPRVVMMGEAREQLKATPIEARPYRPLHVYGNTVRRRQSRGAVR